MPVLTYRIYAGVSRLCADVKGKNDACSKARDASKYQFLPVQVFEVADGIQQKKIASYARGEAVR